MRRTTTITIDDTTVTLTPMTATQIADWEWIGSPMEGTAPMSGYEIRNTTGTLLGVLLCRGYLTGPIHAEYYDPAVDDFFFAGETQRVLTQGVARVLEQYERHVGVRTRFAQAA
jgi:hypothetical protein